MSVVHTIGQIVRVNKRGRKPGRHVACRDVP